jgi:hypothetical protein
MKREDSISLRQLALMLGINASQARKYVLSLGYSPLKARTPDSRGKLTYVFAKEEAERIVATRRQQGFIMGDTRGTPVSSDDVGVFYIIQLVPELNPNRIKFGFAANVQERLTQHRTSAPTACILRSWPSRRTWEPTFIDCLASKGCELILNEVYECGDVAALLDYAEALFKMMPDPQHRVPLSNASPLRTTHEDSAVEPSHAPEPTAGRVSSGESAPSAP